MRSEAIEQEQRSGWKAGFLSNKNWWLFCLAVLLVRLLLLLMDPSPKLQPGESLRYVSGATTGAVPEDLPYSYIYIIRWLCNWAASLTPLVVVQGLLGAAIALMVAWISRSILLLSEWLAYLFGFLCSVDPLQLTWERYVLPETFSLFFYALVLYQSFVYLQTRRLASLILVQVLSILTIGFKLAFLIPLLVMGAALPLIAFCFEAASTRSVSGHRSGNWQFLRRTMFWSHLAISLSVMFVLHQGYRYANGFLSHAEPGYDQGTSYSLMAAWAPAIRPQDSPDPRLAEIISHGTEFGLPDEALRGAQHHRRGNLIDRWRRVEPDKRKSREIASQTALNALRCNPAGVIKIAAKTYYAFWRGPSLERIAKSELGSTTLTQGQQKLLLERYHWHGPVDTGAVPVTFFQRYYIAAAPYYFAILVSPLLSFVLLFVSRNKAYALVLFTQTLLVFITTFLLSIAPTTRSLQPLSLLMLLSVALAVKSLYPSRAGDTNAGEVTNGGSSLNLNGRRQLYTVCGVIAVAAMLRFGLAGNQPLWNDETFSLEMATGHSVEHAPTVANPALGDFVQLNRPQSVEELRHYMQHDNPPAGLARVIRTLLLSDTHPPLYYLLLCGWTLVFETSDFALRAFSILCSLACLPFLAGIARRTGGTKAVVPACLLFAFSPLGISYSTEGRMYSLLWLWLLAVIWVSLVWTEHGQGILLAAGWVGASAAGFLTHYFFVFPWTALVIFLLVRPEKLGRIRLVTCIVLTALVILPWYMKVPETLHAWRIMKDWLKYQPPGFNRLTAVLQLVLQNFSGAGHHESSNFVALVIFGIIFVAMGLRLRLEMFARRRLLLWLLFIAPCAGLVVFDFVMHTYTVAHDRYAIAALPIACLLAAEALTWLSYATRLLLVVLILLAWAPNSLIDYRTGARLTPRHRAEMVSAKETPTDLLIISAAPGGVLDIVRYLNGPAPILTWLPVWVPQPTRRIPESIREFAAGRTRILWLASAGCPDVTPERDWLRANTLVFEETKIFSDFRPKASPTF